jgi:predicted MPP superfamily phosphohydrolase
MCMYVSAGLGNTVPVPRVFDPPELVLIEIKRKD